MHRNPSETIKGFCRKPISADQAKDTGMAMVLVCLLISIFPEQRYFDRIAILCLLVAMTWPNLYKPVARIWLGLSHLLGTFMSRVVLSLLFIGLVVPMGLFRKLLGKDPLRLTEWKKGKESVFRLRSETFRRENIQRPY